MKIDTMGIELGDHVRDRLTGFEGVVSAATKYLTGCARVAIQPPVDKDNKIPDAVWFDAPMVDVVSRAVVEPLTAPASGGPQRNEPSGR